LDDVLKHLADVNGNVFYSRENPESDPGPDQDKTVTVVLDKIIAHRLPVKLMVVDPEAQPTSEPR
jgi:hypothetical protein